MYKSSKNICKTVQFNMNLLESMKFFAADKYFSKLYIMQPTKENEYLRRNFNRFHYQN